MKHIKSLKGSLSHFEGKGCGNCQASCQSACKTSCTVGNQVCQN
ncbi:six-cysteine ranthipeptide SCIFF [Carboxydothermus pertinax]|nr:six-cysteine ranthipeptide SCIFF [Carboxydothermus pertinax]